MKPLAKLELRDLILIALFSALLCVISPYAIPIAAVPITLATFAVYLAGATLGAARGVIAVTVYLIIGAVGVPVFSNFGAGIGKFVGPTGGYLIGYIPLAFCAGFFAQPRFSKLKGARFPIGMIIGTVVLYLIGSGWYSIWAKVPFWTALIGNYLYLPGDAIKITAASILAPVLRYSISRIPERNRAG